MLTSFRESGRLKVTLFLLAISIFCVALSAFRVVYTHTNGYLFLDWNLFLAFLPWLLTSLARLRKVRNRAAILVIIAVWLLFFPNCLYILTDLVHLREIENAPLWLDFILVLSFSWAGLCYGFSSLMDIEYFLGRRFRVNAALVAVLSTAMIYVASFGIYIGRFWRWNSWDILGNTAQLMQETFDRFAGGNYYRIFGFTILMGTLLNFMYFFIRHRRWNSAA